VIDSRPVRLGVRRRRECTVCQQRFSTVEAELPPEVRVGKARGRPSEPFQPEKILRLLRRLSKDGALSEDEVDTILSAVVNRIRRNSAGLVESRAIAAIIAEILGKDFPRIARRFLADYDGAIPAAKSSRGEAAAVQRELPLME